MTERTQEDGLTAAALFDLSGRKALVTGGGTGLGLQMAGALAEFGADVAICGRNAERCEAAAARLAEYGTETIGVGCDVAERDQVERMVGELTSQFGRLDVLVNNSGTSWGAPIEQHPIEAWQKVIGVNLTGALHCSQAVGRVMLSAGHGRIVNVASVAGLRSTPPRIRSAPGYSASKAGLIALTRELASAWGQRGINVNAIAPGWFPTAISDHTLDREGERILDGIPLGRFGGPGDLKGAIVFLCSRASDYVTGQILVVDGGKTIW